ncbi:MAG: hypothetical protein R3F43_28645 [bacterium]
MVDLLTGILARAQQRVGEEDGCRLRPLQLLAHVQPPAPALGVVELVDKSLLLSGSVV